MYNDRYKRNILITNEEQNTLWNSKVYIFGCGGLGGYVIECLARIGVGEFVLIDGDKFSESNLNRQLYSLEKNLGKSKVEEAKKRINDINSDIKVETIFKFLEEKDFGEIIDDSASCVIDCLDFIEGKIALEKICKEKNVKLISGAIGGLIGHITTVFPGDDTLSKYYGDKKSIGASNGNLSFVACNVASLEASECIKVLLNKNNICRNKILYIDLEYNDFSEIEVK